MRLAPARPRSGNERRAAALLLAAACPSAAPAHQQARVNPDAVIDHRYGEAAVQALGPIARG